MFRALSRLLRNNNIIRILAICEVIIIASSCFVFASTQDINGMTQTVYNFTLWSDYTTNVQAYYGNQTASFSDTTITTIARWLQQIKYYYADQTHTLYMYVPSTNTIQSVTGRHIPEIISYLNYNLAQDAKINYESELLLSRLVTQMGGTNGSYVQDIALDVDSYLPSLTELTNINNSLNKINWDYTSSGSFVDSYFNVITTSMAVYPNNNYYFYFTYPANNVGSLYKFSLPVSPNSTTFTPTYNIKFYNRNTSNNILYEIKAGYIQVYNPAKSSLDVYLMGGYFDYSNIVINVNPIDRYTFNANKPINLYYMNSDNADYFTVLEFMYQKSNNEKLDNINITASLDDDDIINAINNLALQDNDVKLNLTINNNTGSDGTSVINRLQNFFNTGTSISDFFDNVDDAEIGWFTQTNSDLINTLSGGYVNLYE